MSRKQLPQRFALMRAGSRAGLDTANSAPIDLLEEAVKASRDRSQLFDFTL
jgi:hypothetical protein